MHTDQTNKITMFKTVNGYLNLHNAVWRGIPLMVTTVQQFNDLIAAIDLAAQKQETPITGATVDKAAARDALEDVLFLTSEALGVLGYSQDDQDLVALTNLTPSTLAHMNVEELSNRATNLATQARARVSDLAELNVTSEIIDELDRALHDYTSAKESPRMAAAARMVHTKSLAELLRDAANVLREVIDPMVTLFRRTNPDFVGGYRGARVTIDRPATHKTTTSPPPVVSSSAPADL